MSNYILSKKALIGISVLAIIICFIMTLLVATFAEIIAGTSGPELSGTVMWALKSLSKIFTILISIVLFVSGLYHPFCQDSPPTRITGYIDNARVSAMFLFTSVFCGILSSYTLFQHISLRMIMLIWIVTPTMGFIYSLAVQTIRANNSL